MGDIYTHDRGLQFVRRFVVALPSSVTASETLGTFKRRLKTYLFSTSCPNSPKLRTSDFALSLDFEKCS